MNGKTGPQEQGRAGARARRSGSPSRGPAYPEGWARRISWSSGTPAVIGHRESGDGRPPIAPAPIQAKGGGSLDLSTLAKGGLVSLVGSAASSLLAFALVVVITRGLRARGAGVLFEAIALFTILSNAAELGADTGLVRTISRLIALRRSDDLRPTIRLALWPVLIAGTVFAVAAWLTAPGLAGVFVHGASRSQVVSYIRVLAPFLPLATATTVLLAGTRGFGTMKPYVFVQNITIPLLRPILVGLAIFGGLGAIAVGLAWAAPLALGFVAALIASGRLLRREEIRGSSGQPANLPSRLALDFWKFSAARGLAGVFAIGMLWLDILLVGALRSAREAGIYAGVIRYIGVGTFVLGAVAVTISPQISALIALNERGRAKDVFQAGTGWLLIPSWPMYVILAVYAPFFMGLLGREFVAGSTALEILCLGTLFLIGTGNNKNILLMAGGSGWNLAISAFSLGLIICLDLVLIPRYGINGAAVAYAVTLAADNVLTSVVVFALLRLHPFSFGYVVVAAGSTLSYAATGLAARWMIGTNGAGFLVGTVAGTILYLALLWAYRGPLQLTVLRQALQSHGARFVAWSARA